MFDFLFPNHPFGGHTLRLVAQAQQGGGDVFDIGMGLYPIDRSLLKEPSHQGSLRSRSDWARAS